MPEKRVINFFRVVIFSLLTLFLVKTAECADGLPEAPVNNGFRSFSPDNENKGSEYNWRWHLHSDAYSGYDPYMVYDFANFDCPLDDYRVNGRIVPKYHDDFPMHETSGYRAGIRCSELYYPYNYPVPR